MIEHFKNLALVLSICFFISSFGFAQGNWPLWTVNPNGSKNSETGAISDVFAAGRDMDRDGNIDEFHEGVDVTGTVLVFQGYGIITGFKREKRG